ncbi:CDP-glycerol glycerophosphotransferase family protein [Microbacterium betulae]|uniref:CDP-glycerol glycerophosphotransferase family protein n=1 Tax=Microbacterium betulae TaxID=2981139 RepID=A0AA97FKG3_9MICO|nr:CDP-glycerol glycerophosphotransferase family protein [Microbacterium sp. AB]WOF24469.1 CDP-glycerol glycerophosphotransferase family protein [Microbacterium sp. AB]
MKRTTDFLRKAFTSRRAHRAVSRTFASRPLTPHRFRIAVYFADSEVNMYQMRQWYGPLRKLAERWPVVVMARNAMGAKALLDDGALPIAFVPSVTSVERFLDAQDIRIVLYVNQNTRNFQMFRYGGCWHVFINHGESDKMYMTTNQYKAYDFAFVAGQAARNRLSRVLWDYDIDRRTIEIGRPQADHYSADVPYAPDDRTVVLYAPTWEGDRPAARYGSVVTHGVELVDALLATGRHRVVYRPHPRSGVVDRAFGEANARIIQAIRTANEKDPSAQHVYDDGPDLGWQLAAADVAIVDISAMVYDRLAVGKPLLITLPADPAAEIDEGGYLSACEWLEPEGALDIVAEIDRVRADPEATERLAHWVEHYFGDTTPGAATAKFHAAVEQLMAKWDDWNARAGA